MQGEIASKNKLSKLLPSLILDLMYPTFSNNLKDNSSVHSGSSTITDRSRTAFLNGSLNRGRMIPRSNSTSDLFEVPEAQKNANIRKKKPLNGQFPPTGSNIVASQSTSSLTSIGRKNPQGSRAFNNLPSPHGRKKSSKQKDVQNLRGRPQGQQQNRHPMRKGPYISQVKSFSSYSLEPKNSLNPIPERRQSDYRLTPYQLQRKQMKDSFQFPNGESFTPRNRLGQNFPRSNSSTTLNKSAAPLLYPLSRSQSMNSLPLRPNKIQNPIRMGNSSSPVESGSSDSSYNSMRDHSSSGSTNLSSGPSTHSSNSALPLTSFGKDARKSPLTINVNCVASINDEAKMQVMTNSEQVPLSDSLINNDRKPAQTMSQKTLNMVDPSQKAGKLSNSSKPKEDTKTKRGSMTRLSNFFKKIFSLQSSTTSRCTSISSSANPVIPRESYKKKNKRKLLDPDNSPSSSDAVSATEAEPKPKQKNQHRDANSSADIETGGSRSSDHMIESDTEYTAEDDDDPDDILMDTDLVFDSLLLKANSNRSSCLQKQNELRQKLEEFPPSRPSSCDIETKVIANKQKAQDEDSHIDYDLVSEFSRLGTFIQDSPTADTLNLPPRSARRPALTNKESAKSFYHPHPEADFSSELIKRLFRDWKTVHVDIRTPSPVESIPQQPDGKELRFADEVYVNDTWSPSVYERSDKRFIKNRRRMMQLENLGFIHAIKIELNEFKRNDMVVHQESVRFTHFFL